MTVVGSYEGDKAFDQTRIKLMCRQTVEESIIKIQELVRENTPRKSGHLWESVKTSGPRRTSSVSWEGSVSSNLPYTAAIEYGMAPRVITPTHKEALSFFWKKKGVHFVGRKVDWPGYAGHHMFLRGSTAFEKFYAENIAENNARIWLGSVDAGRRTIVI